MLGGGARRRHGRACTLGVCYKIKLALCFTLQYNNCIATNKAHKMQNANTLYYTISLQRNKKAAFIAFSFAQPLRTSVQQRTAHYVATVQNKAQLTTAYVAQVVAAQQLRDKAFNAQACNSESIDKLLCKNDTAAVQQNANY